MSNEIPFSDVFQQLLKWEGGFVDDPDDPGGRTIYGVAERYHPEMWQDGAPSKKDAEALYHDHYWAKVRALQGAGYPKTAAMLFDFCVMSGGAVPQFQTMVGAKPDGVLGPKTVEAFEEFLDNAGVELLAEVRRAYYEGLAERNPRLRKFLRGWLNRVKDWTEWLLMR